MRPRVFRDFNTAFRSFVCFKRLDINNVISNYTFLISTFVRNNFKLKESTLLLTDSFFKQTKYLNVMFKSQKTSGLAFIPLQHN